MIKVSNLSAGYKGREVIKKADFHVERATILGLLGRNGCGKTTLFRCLNGLLKPFSGTIMLGGNDIRGMRQNEIARLAALVPQAQLAAFPLLVIDTILLGAGCHLRAWEAPKAEEKKRAVSLAEQMGIPHLLDKDFDRISGGEQQLALIARALMQDAPILFLDEPTSHLDFTNQHMILNILRQLSVDKELTIVITTHDPNIVFGYCDEVMMIKDGIVLALGKTEKTLSEDNLQALYGNTIKLEKTDTGYVVMPVNSLTRSPEGKNSA